MAESTPYLLPNTQGRYVTVTVTNTSGEVYRINDDGTRTIYGDYFVENGNTVLVSSTFASQEFQNNLAQSPQGYNSTISNSIIQASGGNTTAPAPAPTQQGGSTPITQPTTGTEPTRMMLVYPNDIVETRQDRIMFQAYDYKSGAENRLPGGSAVPVLSSPVGNKVGPAVILPIQSSITDQNSVGWESDVLDPVSLYAANASINLMNAGDTEDITKKVSEIFSQTLKNLKSNAPEVKVALAGAAIGNNNLLSRLQGKVLNPNLELLFQGPQLRPFNYTFKMSARSRPEAVTIKEIIKYFKQNMAVKKGNQIFLKAPNVFKIQYQYANEMQVHRSLNLIKICALTNCSIDYTPLGTYMTYSDGEGTMVAYTMTLSFQELTPIYDTDYTEQFDYGNGEFVPNNHPIGA